MSYHIVPMITEEELSEGIRRIADRISHDYQGKDIHMICVLKGGAYFMTELSKRISPEIPVSIDFMSVSSYGASTASSGVVKIIKDLDEPISGKNVIVVEDIIDTGNTLSYLMEMLRDRGPASLSLCTMLDKPSRRTKNITPDYTVFTVPDKFVVGFGLDYDQRHRNLPYIGVVEFDD